MLITYIVNPPRSCVDGTTPILNGDGARGDLKPLAVSLAAFLQDGYYVVM